MISSLWQPGTGSINQEFSRGVSGGRHPFGTAETTLDSTQKHAIATAPLHALAAGLRAEMADVLDSLHAFDPPHPPWPTLPLSTHLSPTTPCLGRRGAHAMPLPKLDDILSCVWACRPSLLYPCHTISVLPFMPWRAPCRLKVG